MFPTRLITQPILWEMSKKFEVVPNVRQASVTDEIGLVSLSLQGEREEIKKAIDWLESLGVKVEPVEINTIEARPPESCRILSANTVSQRRKNDSLCIRAP
jgi:hypothetical protein